MGGQLLVRVDNKQANAVALGVLLCDILMEPGENIAIDVDACDPALVLPDSIKEALFGPTATFQCGVVRLDTKHYRGLLGAGYQTTLEAAVFVDEGRPSYRQQLA